MDFPRGDADVERECKYRYINSQLEAKTMNLLKEVEEMLTYGGKPADDDFRESQNNSPPCCSSLTETVDSPKQTSDSCDKEVYVTEFENRDEHNKDEINDGNILPEPAAGLSLNAQNRYLKAKVRVLMEENQKLNSQINHQSEETVRMKNRIQELEEERNRLHRVTSSHSSQLEKMKKSLGETRTHCNTLETEKTNYKKDYDSVKRSLDQQAAEIKTLTTRLNRATEESDRYKVELEKVRSSTRESVESLRHNVDNLMAENRRLEKQKSELIGAFKKQMKLIDVLRRQKMLIEASKCLQITEEEFLKALDW
ncbi:unnamed protein product [Heterobilharzia americana]|nr:unnamed protein product [Heterobilharzia americana]